MFTVSHEPNKRNCETAHVNPAYVTALDVVDRGMRVTPLCWPDDHGRCACPKQHTTEKEAGKAPLLNAGYLERLLSREEVEQLGIRYPQANWAVLLESSGLFVLDADSLEADREVEERGVPPGPRVRRDDHIHRYFLNTTSLIGNAIKTGASGKIDILALGYVLLPGSRHRSGLRYEAEVWFDDIEMEGPPGWAVDILQQSIANRATAESIPDDLAPVDIDTLEVSRFIRALIRCGPDADPAKYSSRSEAVFACLMGLLHAGYSDTALLASILLDPRYQISEKPREQGHRWVASEIARAKSKFNSNGHAAAPFPSDADAPPAYQGNGQANGREPPPLQEKSDAAENAHMDAHELRLPEISVTNRPLRDIAGDALKALEKKNTPPFLFVRSAALARIVYDERHCPLIETVGESALRGYLTRSAEFFRVTAKHDKKTDEVKFINTHVPPPKEVVQDVLSLAIKPFPPLNGIVECPVLRPSGTIITAPGYDSETRLYYEPTSRLQVPALPLHPTEADARQARDFLLQELLFDFPFAEGADLANMMACLLTPIIRPAIAGNVPLCLLDKPGPGSGATLLSDVVATVATGEHAVKETAPESGRHSEEEWRKKITALLLAGASVIVWDNIENSIDSSALSAVLTTSLWGDRVLGESRTLRLVNRATWIATANNIHLRGDLARRCYRVRIDPEQERPWTREGFKHPDLLAWVRGNRGQLLCALLTIARAWYVKGKPSTETPKLGSFEHWVATIGGILAYAGIPDFLGNQEDLYSLVDDEGPEWRGFLKAWYEQFGEREITVRYLAGFLSANPAENPLLQTLPESVEWDADKLDPSRKRLGKALKKRAFRVYGQFRLERGSGDAHSKVASWRVKLCGVLRGLMP
jgi:hypothetical protein